MKQPSEWIVTVFDGDSNPIYEEEHCSYTGQMYGIIFLGFEW